MVPPACIAADVDGDGDMDVLCASSTNDMIAWYENNGSETFTRRTISTAADAAFSVFAADVDGDGDMDVLQRIVVRRQDRLVREQRQPELHCAHHQHHRR